MDPGNQWQGGPHSGLYIDVLSHEMVYEMMHESEDTELLCCPPSDPGEMLAMESEADADVMSISGPVVSKRLLHCSKIFWQRVHDNSGDPA